MPGMHKATLVQIRASLQRFLSIFELNQSVNPETQPDETEKKLQEIRITLYLLQKEKSFLTLLDTLKIPDKFIEKYPQNKPLDETSMKQLINFFDKQLHEQTDQVKKIAQSMCRRGISITVTGTVALLISVATLALGIALFITPTTFFLAAGILPVIAGVVLVSLGLIGTLLSTDAAVQGTAKMNNAHKINSFFELPKTSPDGEEAASDWKPIFEV